MSAHYLSSIPLFSTLAAEELTALEQCLRPREYGPNQTIIWIGEPGEEMFVVESGTVIISAPGETEAEVILGTLSAGNFFGELSLLDGGPRTATARSREAVKLLALDRQDFYKFLEKHPQTAIHILQVLGQRQREMVDKVRGIKNVNEAIAERTTKLQRFMDKVADFGASQKFLFANLLFLASWITVNVLRMLRGTTGGVLYDAPPTFYTLCFIIGLQAIVLTMFVLNSQKRQSERDRIQGDLEYQVNLKAHHEVMQLHRKVDRLEAMIAGKSGGTTGREKGPSAGP